MKKLFFPLATALVLTGATLAAPAHAAPRQFVIVVAEGLSPQILEMGKSYLRKADEEPDATTAFDALMAAGKPAAANADALAGLQGLLETARKNGFKTGLVTSGDVTAVAPLFYDVQGDPAAALTGADAKYDFLAGGGRAKFTAEQTGQIKAAGGTYLANEEAFDAEVKGRALALQGDADLAYSIDRNPEEAAGLAELTGAALDTLGADNAPFVLVVHDTLVKKALDTKDTPALLEQFRELNSVVADVVGRRADSPQLAAAVLLTGGSVTPRFTTTNVDEQNNAFFVLSNLSLSFAGAGEALKDADAEKLKGFADAEEGQYRGWKITPETSAAIVAGTTTPEAAIRASYEPALKIEYAAAPAAPVAYAVGFDADAGLVDALKKAVSMAPAPIVAQ